MTNRNSTNTGLADLRKSLPWKIRTKSQATGNSLESVYNMKGYTDMYYTSALPILPKIMDILVFCTS